MRVIEGNKDLPGFRARLDLFDLPDRIARIVRIARLDQIRKLLA